MARGDVFTLQGECWGEWDRESPGRSAWTGGACYLTPGAGAGGPQGQRRLDSSEVSCYLTPGVGVGGPQSRRRLDSSEISCYLTPYGRSRRATCCLRIGSFFIIFCISSL